MAVRVFVGNLALEACASILEDAFGGGGRTVESVELLRRPRGFAFVEMGTPADAAAAVAALDGAMLCGKKLRVRLAHIETRQRSRAAGAATTGRAGVRPLPRKEPS